MTRFGVRTPMVGVLALALAATGSVGASGAAPAAPPGVSMQGTGRAPKGVGLFSAAALAQDGCAANGRMRSNYEGAGPFCVNPWPSGKDNGGATAPGVTATEVKVVAYVPPRSVFAASGQSVPKDLATGASTTAEEALADHIEAWNHAVEELGTFQLWGRRPVIEVVYASGTDEASQRADAVEVADRKPFMVVDVVDASRGQAVFAAELASREIVVASASTNAKNGAQQSPYRWNFGADPSAAAPLAASFVSRSLAGRKARWAGDQELTTRTRVLGVLHPSTDFDIDEFERLVRQRGTKFAETLAFDPTASDLDQTIPALVNRLKTSGVTSVVLFTDSGMMNLVMRTATEQGYFPEWILTSWGYHDWDGFGRTADQEQMQHAFGLGFLWPATNDDVPLENALSTWYWGADQGTSWSPAAGLMSFVYHAMHYAGPTLTAENVKRGFFAAPTLGGAADGTTYYQIGLGRTAGLPYDQYAWSGADRALIWWDADNTEPSDADSLLPGRPGQYVHLYGGKRFNMDEFPKHPKFFDERTSVVTVPGSSRFPDGKIPEATPCPGCPSDRGGA